ENEPLARFAAGRRQQQRRHRQLRPARLRYLVEVPVGAAAGEVALSVLHHPIRQVRRELGFGHGVNSLISCSRICLRGSIISIVVPARAGIQLSASPWRTRISWVIRCSLAASRCAWRAAAALPK